jgi:hypothetical protein
MPMMLRAVSAATQLHEVLVIHEQTRKEWSASRAAIEQGRIIVAGSPLHPFPPPPTPAATFTILALDGGNRRRTFRSVKLDAEASRPPKRYVFV